MWSIDRKKTEADNINVLMQRLKIRGLPRNYELFYEALYGAQDELRKDITALGVGPGQVLIDEVGLKHRLPAFWGYRAEQAGANQSRVIRSLSEHIGLASTGKTNFLRSLETVTGALDGATADEAQAIIAQAGFLGEAFADVTRFEQQLVEKLEKGLEQLDAGDRFRERAAEATLRDRLTSLPNRAALQRKLADAYDGATVPQEMALIIADIDGFALFNRTYGAGAGNRVLKQLGTIFRKAVKKDDFAARSGGDEFAFLIHGVTKEDAVGIAARLRAQVEDNLIFASEMVGPPLTLSFGLAMTANAPSPAHLRAQAEAALAAARANERTPVVAFGPDIARANMRNSVA
jgi:diguanylate cyclase (GGDEF)-like protein